MNEGGFDCILGNPPFLGGLKISLNNSYNFLTWLHYNYPSAKGTCDLVAYFFRRSFSIISKNGFASLISTNTISQGDTRTGSLEVITKEGVINHAVKSMKWPGLAAVEVALVTVTKRKWLNLLTLNNKTVSSISSYLDESEPSNVPYELTTNRGLSYIGSFILGDGFILSATEAKILIKQNIENGKAIFPVLNGDEINSSFKIIKERYAINFFDFSYEYVKSNFPLLLKIIEENVKPDREKITWSKSAREKWWLYERPRVELYKAAIKLDSVFVTALTGKYLCFTKVKPEFTFTHAVGVIVDTSFASFNLLQSSFHEIWAWKFCSSMGISLRYAPSDGFQNFPFPLNWKSEKKRKSEQLGEEYYLRRSSLMVKTQLGLTKTYNAFHAKEITANLSASADLTGLDKKSIEKQYGKEVWNLWNHLQKTPGTCTFEEAVAGIVRLRELHVEMDQAVLEAYGWAFDTSTPLSDLSAQAPGIKLKHDFYEVDYLPENDRVRYTIHPDARKEILKRLLELNHKIHEEEIKQGLHRKADVEKFYAQKGESVPQNIVSSDTKPKKKRIKKENIQTQAAQRSLFDDVNNTIMKEFSLHEGIYSIGDTAGIINQPYDKVRRWFLKLSEANYEGLSDSAKTDIENRRISFHGLVELVIIGELLEAGVKARKIFKARLDLSSIINKPYPFATSDVKDKLKVSGSDIVFDFEKGLVTLDGSRQFNFEFIREFFAEIEFKSGIAIRLLPAKGFKRIQINPKAAGGRPAFVSQKDVKVETILRFYKGPDSVEEIIEDYGISEEDIKAALAYQS